MTTSTVVVPVSPTTRMVVPATPENLIALCESLIEKAYISSEILYVKAMAKKAKSLMRPLQQIRNNLKNRVKQASSGREFDIQFRKRLQWRLMRYAALLSKIVSLSVTASVIANVTSPNLAAQAITQPKHATIRAL